MIITIYWEVSSPVFFNWGRPFTNSRLDRRKISNIRVMQDQRYQPQKEKSRNRHTSYATDSKMPLFANRTKIKRIRCNFTKLKNYKWQEHLEICISYLIWSGLHKLVAVLSWIIVSWISTQKTLTWCYSPCLCSYVRTSNWWNHWK